MQVIKKINNNVALCRDNNDRELIAFGKGIGFPKMPYTISDMSSIDRTFYCVSDERISLLQEIPMDIIVLTNKIIDYAQSIIEFDINETIYFSLADHINYAIIRAKQGLYLTTGLSYEIASYYPEEMKISLKVIDILNKRYKLNFPKDEAGTIAMHFVENENRDNTQGSVAANDKVVDEITLLIEEDFNIIIDRTSFNYSRFVSHIQYMLLRTNEKISIDTENKNLFTTLTEQYPIVYHCCNKIVYYFNQEFNWSLTEEEQLYLMLHLNRLLQREDCNH